MPGPRNRAAAELDARMKLKRAARRLFAERGFRNVTVRDVATAAGQRNHGAVGYYFGTKENLAKEILVDGARVIEAQRNALLDALEARASPPTVRELVEAIIVPSVELVWGDPDEDQYFNRYMRDLGANHPDLILEALEDRWNVGYQRCLRLLRPLMPDLTLAEKNRRFAFLGAYLGPVLALRESILSDRTRGHRIWRSEGTLQDVIETATAILTAPLPASERRADADQLPARRRSL